MRIFLIKPNRRPAASAEWYTSETSQGFVPTWNDQLLAVVNSISHNHVFTAANLAFIHGVGLPLQSRFEEAWTSKVFTQQAGQHTLDGRNLQDEVITHDRGPVPALMTYFEYLEHRQNDQFMTDETFSFVLQDTPEAHALYTSVLEPAFDKLFSQLPGMGVTVETDIVRPDLYLLQAFQLRNNFVGPQADQRPEALQFELTFGDGA